MCNGSNWYSNQKKMMPSNEQPGSNHMNLFHEIEFMTIIIIVGRGVRHAMDHKLFKIIFQSVKCNKCVFALSSTGRIAVTAFAFPFRTIFRH